MSSEDQIREPDSQALEERIAQLEFERDGYYGEWRHAQNQLDLQAALPGGPVPSRVDTQRGGLD
jgi:hypothetical protein